MLLFCGRITIAAGLVLAVAGGGVSAQEPAIVDGTLRFLDDPAFGNDQCTIVNTLGEEFFVRQCDRRLVLARSIFSGNELTLQENNADELTDFTVLPDLRVVDERNSARTGKLMFGTDANGLRTLFWVADDESFDPVDGRSVRNGVLSYDRMERSVTLVIANVLDDQGNVLRREPFFPSDLGANIGDPQLGNRELFLPCGADRTIIDVDDRGEPVLGCDLLGRSVSACGPLGSVSAFLFLFCGVTGIRRRFAGSFVGGNGFGF